MQNPSKATLPYKGLPKTTLEIYYYIIIYCSYCKCLEFRSDLAGRFYDVCRLHGTLGELNPTFRLDPMKELRLIDDIYFSRFVGSGEAFRKGTIYSIISLLKIINNADSVCRDTDIVGSVVVSLYLVVTGGRDIEGEKESRRRLRSNERRP